MYSNQPHIQKVVIKDRQFLIPTEKLKRELQLKKTEKDKKTTLSSRGNYICIRDGEQVGMTGTCRSNP